MTRKEAKQIIDGLNAASNMLYRDGYYELAKQLETERNARPETIEARAVLAAAEPTYIRAKDERVVTAICGTWKPVYMTGKGDTDHARIAGSYEVSKAAGRAWDKGIAECKRLGLELLSREGLAVRLGVAKRSSEMASLEHFLAEREKAAAEQAARLATPSPAWVY